MMCSMLDHNYFFHAPSTPLVRWETRVPSGRFRWCSSARLNQVVPPRVIANGALVLPTE